MSEQSTENELVIDAFHNNNDIKWIKFPYQITDIDAQTNAELLKDFTGERTGFVQVGPKKWFFPSGYKKNAEIYYNFQPRPDDVWIVTFPRSGTTWTQELIWLLSNDLNYEVATEIPLNTRFPFFEFSSFCHPEVKNEFLKENSFSQERCSIIEEITKPVWKTLKGQTERRFIKTHLPFQLLPPNLLEIGCKVIYIARNPKDVAVSFFHLNRLYRTQNYLRDFPKYWDYFEKGLQPWTPYWSHIEEGWERRNEENLLFMFYENMNKVVDLKNSIRNVSKFLGVKYSNEQYDTLEEHLKIENFRNNKSVNAALLKDLYITNNIKQGFIRNGKNGEWGDCFDDKLNYRADKWIEDNLRKTAIRFPTFE